MLRELNRDEVYGMSDIQRKDLFIELLTSTNRPGIENVLGWLETTDFFSAPASTVFHSNFDGGLLFHSLMVYAMTVELYNSSIKIRNDLKNLITEENIIISSLLHDVCKCNCYTKTSKNRKIDGSWKTVEGYEHNDKFPFGHGEKSVVYLLSCGLKLEGNEMLAIRWHMSNWDGITLGGLAEKNLRDAKTNCPLVSLLISADDTATNILEDVFAEKVIGC